MKGLMLGTAMLTGILGLVSLSPCLHAQESQSITQAQDSSQQQDVQTFNGTITKESDTFVLKDAVNNVTYRLDDQEKAKAHEGKQVKVTGTLDTATNTIRMSGLEPSA